MILRRWVSRAKEMFRARRGNISVRCDLILTMRQRDVVVTTSLMKLWNHMSNVIDIESHDESTWCWCDNIVDELGDRHVVTSTSMCTKATWKKWMSSSWRSSGGWLTELVKIDLFFFDLRDRFWPPRREIHPNLLKKTLFSAISPKSGPCHNPASQGPKWSFCGSRVRTRNSHFSEDFPHLPK